MFLLWAQFCRGENAVVEQDKVKVMWLPLPAPFRVAKSSIASYDIALL